MGLGDLLSIVIVLIMAAMSWRAEHRLRHAERLPMQWGLNGKPTWYAPRRIAVAFLPLLAACTFILLAVAQRTTEDGNGIATDNGRLIFGLSLIAVHWFHLHLAEKECR